MPRKSLNSTVASLSDDFSVWIEIVSWLLREERICFLFGFFRYQIYMPFMREVDQVLKHRARGHLSFS